MPQGVEQSQSTERERGVNFAESEAWGVAPPRGAGNGPSTGSASGSGSGSNGSHPKPGPDQWSRDWNDDGQRLEDSWPVQSQSSAMDACLRLIALLESAQKLDARNRSDIDDAVKIPLAPYVAAQFRMRVHPALSPEWSRIDPIHVVLFGGTNSGKSTVLNVLAGRPVAVMNPTARYSQHPEAYRDPFLGDDWIERFPLRFAGYSQYENAHPPRQSDEDLFRNGYNLAFAIHDLPAADGEALGQGQGPGARPSGAGPIVYWDCPDFSTEQARIYLQAVIDSVALADVVIMAVTEESYADDRGLSYLRMLTNSGVAVLVVANKLPEAPDERQALAPDMVRKLGENRRDPTGALPSEVFHILPRARGATPEARLDYLLKTDEARAFREAIRRAAQGGARRKRQTLLHVLDFMDRRFEDILRPIQAEVEEADRWGQAVERIAREQFLQRYRTDYLDGKGYGEFNRTLVRVMELLKLPYVGEAIQKLGETIRLPLNLVKSAANKLWHKFGGTKSKIANKSPEHDILDQLLENWFAELKSHAQMLAGESSNPAWPEILRTLDSQAHMDQVDERFFEAYLLYRKDIEREEAERAKQIYEKLEANPALLNSIRGGRAIIDVALIGLIISHGGLNWSDAVVGPLVAGMTQLMMEGGPARLPRRTKTLA